MTLRKYILLLGLIIVAHYVYAQVKPLSDINTPYYCEYSPSVSFDGKRMIFESNRSGEWRLYESQRMGEGRWSNPRYLHTVNNSIGKKLFVGGCFQSYDGKYLLMTSDREDGLGDMDILISEKKNGSWSEPENIGIPINTVYFEGFPSLSTDGTELYFMRNFKPGREPDPDRYYLYVSAKKESGDWGEPKLLPDEINQYPVECPRLLPNGQSLLFASKRPDSRGGFDIYRSNKLVDGNWSLPQNLEMLNSPIDENTFTVDASGEQFYFARTLNGIDDLYAALIPKIEEVVSTLQLKGRVLDAESGKSIAANLTLIDADTGEELKVLATTENNPAFSVYLERGKNLIVEANCPGYSFGSEMIMLKSPELNVNETENNRLELDEIFTQLIMNEKHRTEANEALRLTNEANRLLVGDKINNDNKIEELNKQSLKAPDTKSMKKILSSIDNLKRDNQKIEDEAIGKYRMANQSFLNLLSGYINNYNVTSNEKIATLGQNHEAQGMNYWSEAKTERSKADNSKSTLTARKHHKKAKELEINAINSYAMAFEYYLQYLNFNKNIIEKDIMLTPLEKNVTIVLKNIQFDFDSDAIKKSSETELKMVLQLMEKNPNLKIEVSAHTDSQGGDEYNLNLSERRATSVVNWLVDRDISTNRLKAVGFGESKPLLPNDSEENMAKNRRVEFKILEN